MLEIREFKYLHIIYFVYTSIFFLFPYSFLTSSTTKNQSTNSTKPNQKKLRFLIQFLPILKNAISPSCITYVLPCDRVFPASLHLTSEPCSLKSLNGVISA
jgi:hypothetical protein